MSLGLLLIDIQNDYFPGGRNELCGAEKAVFQAVRLLSFFREKRMPVFHIRHINDRQGSTFFLPETMGSEIHTSVAPIKNETIIIKHSPDSFFQTGLNELLNKSGIRDLAVCGMMTHMCVDTTVRAAKNYGYNITLMEDACATKDLTHNGNIIPAATVGSVYMASLEKTFAKIINTEKWLQEYA